MMMNYLLTMMYHIFEMTDLVSEMMDFVLKMMDFIIKTDGFSQAGHDSWTAAYADEELYECDFRLLFDSFSIAFPLFLDRFSIVL